MRLPQRRPDDIWRRKYYPNPSGLEIGTLISAVSPSKMVFFLLPTLGPALSQNNGAVLWEQHQAAIWPRSDLEVACVQGCAHRRAHTHTLLYHGEKLTAPMIESIILCSLITRLFLFWLTTTFLFILCAMPFER